MDTPDKALLNAEEVARFFVARAHECQDLITNMKLQKLLYYAYSWFLVERGARLFGESIKAWKHGPVVPEVYHVYKDRGASPIIDPGEVPAFDPAITEFLDSIWQDFGSESALRLMRMTHNEPPYIEAWNRVTAENPSPRIADDSIHKYFTELAASKQ